MPVDHYENFPVASILMPKRLRKPVAAIYHFARAADDIKSLPAPQTDHGALPAPVPYAAPAVPRALRDVMSRHVGLERSEAGLKEALLRIAQIERAGCSEPSLLNMTATARLVAAAALVRHESRGSHSRSDYPQTDPVGRRRAFTLAEADAIAAEAAPDHPACAAR